MNLAEEMAERELARKHLLPFVMRGNDHYIPGWVHKDVCRRLEKFTQDVIDKASPRLMITFPPRHGKLLAHSTPIYTTSGLKTHGDLRSGDYVFAPDGSPIRVLGVSEEMLASYVVELSDGQKIKCHGNHEWSVYCRGGNDSRGYRTLETRYFTESTHLGRPPKLVSIDAGKKRYRYQLPVAQAQQFPEQLLPIHPYVLGAWLGDGSTGKPCITHSAEDTAVVEHVQELGYQVSRKSIHKDTGAVTTYFSGPRPNVAGDLTKQLQALGVWGSKHIPSQYLYSSIQQRYELLAGLIDTDGSVCKKTGRVRFITTSESLKEGVFTLLQTLSLRPYITRVEPCTSSSGISGKLPVYYIGFQPTQTFPTQIPRKKIRRLIKQRRLGIVSVTKTDEPELGHCIQVDADDGLYQVLDGVITHNSELVSRNFPAWFLGKFPNLEVISCSYSGSLANDFSRKVRNLMREPHYHQLFPDAELDADTQAVGFWATTKGGSFLPAGVSGPISGRGMHVGIIDDPIKNREEAESETTRESIWDWYTSTFYTRLAPGGGILVIQCMTGDTPILMADGETKPLIDVKVGDQVATFDSGILSTSTILNHASNGRDSVYRITTSSGKIVRANKRHPFLVQNASGELEWVRTKNLKSGLRIVTLKDSGVSGRESNAKLKDASYQSDAVVSATHTITSGSGQAVIEHPQNARIHVAGLAQNSNTVTASHLPITKESWKHKMASALFASRLLNWLITLSTGLWRSALTIAITPEKSVDCCATNVTSLSNQEMGLKSLNELPSISDFTTEKIVSVEYDGEEEVFDVQVDRTENFIANGLVSHNTRWHHDDLAGRLLEEMKNGGDQWELVEYPAIAIEDEPYRKKGEALHPDRFDISALERIKRAVGPRDWQALYQQRPTADEGDYFTKQMLRTYRHRDLPPRDDLMFYTCWDLAVGTKEVNDYSVGVTVGVDRDDNIWLVDLFRKRCDAGMLIDEILDTWELWRPEVTGLEEGVIKHSIGPFLERRAQERNCFGFFAEPLKVGKKDKEARARSIQGRMKQGKVFLPEDAGFYPDLVNELLQFPNGKHDDQVDALAHVGELLMLLATKRLPHVKKPKSWRDRLQDITRDTVRGSMAS